MKPYQSPSWKQFRADVIKLDGGACCRCGASKGSGAILQVHHKEYVSGRLPWEYPFEACETLCKGCHAIEHGIIPPNFGWDFLGHDDLGDLIGECDYCGTQIRHVFLISHPKWGALEVGEVCCDNLTCTEVASSHMESIRRFRDRQKTFVSSSRWRGLPSGSEWISQKGFQVELTQGPAYRLRVNGLSGQSAYVSSVDAKMKIFGLIESGGLLAYFLSKKRLRRSLPS